MRREVVIDDTGRILASAPHPDDIAYPDDDEDAPRYLGYVADEGQHVHVVEFPDSISSEELRDIHRTHRVSVSEGEARLESRASD